MPMKDALCSDVINGFRSGSGPHLTELETRIPSNNSVCVRIMLEPWLDGKRDWKNVVVKKTKSCQVLSCCHGACDLFFLFFFGSFLSEIVQGSNSRACFISPCKKKKKRTFWEGRKKKKGYSASPWLLRCADGVHVRLPARALSLATSVRRMWRPSLHLLLRVVGVADGGPVTALTVAGLRALPPPSLLPLSSPT